MQIKTIIKYHYTPIMLAKTKKTIPSVEEDRGQFEFLCMSGENVKCTVTLEIYFTFS